MARTRWMGVPRDPDRIPLTLDGLLSLPLPVGLYVLTVGAIGSGQGFTVRD